MKIYLIRHGETTANQARVFSGQTDVALTEKGRAQAQQVNEALEEVTIDHAYCSNLTRAKDTCDIILGNRMIEKNIVSAFQERHFGDLENRNIMEVLAEAEKKFPEKKDDILTLDVPNGETLEQVSERVMPAFYEMVNQHGKNSDQTILLVAHAGTIQTIMSNIVYGDVSGFWRFRIMNCGITMVEYSGDYLVVNMLNSQYYKVGEK